MSIIRKLRIDGFKSIWKARLELGQLNVFIGTNGAGKSNLLEALAMLSASVEGGVDYERLHRRGARLSAYEVFKSSFKNRARRASIRLDAESDSFCYSADLYSEKGRGFSYLAEKFLVGGKLIAGRSNHGARIMDERLGIDSLSSISIPLKFKMKEDMFSTLREFAIYAPSTPVLRGVNSDESKKEPLGLYGGRLAEALHEAIKSNEKGAELQRFFHLLDWFKSIGTSAPEKGLVSDHISLGPMVTEFTDAYMRTNFKHLYAYDVSEGALYVLFVLLLFLHPQAPNMFALDNVDSALNPALVRSLMGHIAEILRANKRKQVFLTTHNPTALDAIDLFDETHRLFVVERGKDGSTEFRRISPPSGVSKEDWGRVHSGMKLSDIWLSGAIGGLPRGF